MLNLKILTIFDPDHNNIENKFEGDWNFLPHQLYIKGVDNK